jgi:hypothetical protein
VKKERIGFSTPGYRWQWCITHPHEVIQHYWRELICFYRRGMYGYSYRDLWSLDWYLLQWLPTAIRELNRTRHSYPADMTDEEWGKVLEEMADGFEVALKIQDELWIEEQHKKEYAQAERAFELFAKYFYHLWD